MAHWEAVAEYQDGTRIEKTFPADYECSWTDGNQRFEIESWLMEQHEGITYYSVDLVED